MNKRPTIGFYIPNLIGEYFENQWFIINQAAIEADVNLIIFSPLMFIADSEYQEMYSNIFKYGGKENVDGLIISTASFHCYFENREINEFINQNKEIPIVSIGEEIKGISSILIDNYTSMKELISHFIKDHGYKKVAFIQGKEGNIEADERFAAYKDVLVETGIPYDNQLVIQGDFGLLSGKQGVSELLDVRHLTLDAIIAANDDMILGVYTEMVNRGIHIPGDVALGGFDNIKAIQELPCPITTVQQAIDEQIKMALDLVLDLINCKQFETKIIIPSRIIIRESCGCHRLQNNEQKDENGYVKLRKMVENQEKYANTQQGYSVGLLSNFFTDIINADDFNVIKRQCEKLFAQIGINSCNLALYNKGFPLFIGKDTIPPLYSDTFFLYEDTSMIKKNEIPYHFETKKFFKHMMFNSNKRHTFVMSELIFKNEYYGFMLLEMSDINPLVINLFKIQCANSLHNIYTRHEIEKAYTNLEEAKISAESANKFKSHFLANMSHEIRTPMNAILGFINILIEQETDEVKLDYMHIIDDSGKTLLHLINDILDLSKIEAGRIELVEKEIYLSRLFSNLNNLFEIQAKEKGIKLDIHLDVSVPIYIMGDEIRLRQILTNIIGNGLKFTNKGSVTVHATLHERKLMVQIKDTGIGIPEKKLDEIFSPFKQEDSTIERQFGGTGLGLAISRSFAELMGGTIKAKSRKGKGSTFTLILPLQIARKKKENTDENIETEIRKLNSRSIIETWIKNKRESPRVLPILYQAIISLPSLIHKLQNAMITNKLTDIEFVSHELKGMSGNLEMTEVYERVSSINTMAKSDDPDFDTMRILCRELVQFCNQIPPKYLENDFSEEQELESIAVNSLILVADDNEVSRKLLSVYLRELNLKIEFAENGAQVLKKLNEQKFKLLLMDIRMPVMDGITTIKQIRKNKKIKNIFAIAITAHAVKGEAQKYLAMGFDDYISKPIEKYQFQSKIKKQLLIDIKIRESRTKDHQQKNKDPGLSISILDTSRIIKLKKIAIALKKAASIFNEKQALAILNEMNEFRDIPVLAELCNSLKKSISEYNSLAMSIISNKICDLIAPGQEDMSD